MSVKAIATLTLPTPKPQYDSADERNTRSQIETFALTVARTLVSLGNAATGGITSVFGRTGAIVAAANDYAFSMLSGIPTTIAGYGITDAASLASPALTGTPTAPTAAPGTNNTQLATTAFVAAASGSGLPTSGGTMTGPITETEIATPSTPAAGKIALYANSRAGRAMQYILDPNGRASALQASLADERIVSLRSIGGAVAPVAEGMAAPTTHGTAITTSLGTSSRLLAAPRAGYTSASAINSACDILTPLMCLPADASGGPGGFDFYARITHITNVASTRFFAGLAAQTTNVCAGGDPGALTNPAKIGIALDTADANYQFVHNAAGGAVTKLSLGIARASGTTFDMWLFSATGVVGVNYLIVNVATGAVVASGVLTSTVPTSAALLNFQVAGYTVAATSPVEVGMSDMICTMAR